jgi:exopolysaccharide production protein ExoZ
MNHPVPPTMHGVQALRFFAAFGVVVFHVLVHGQSTRVIPPGISPHFTFFASGVPVFFALSDFLMAKISENASPLRFLLDRAIRLYPGLWLATGLAVAATYAVFHVVYPRDWLWVLSLLPAGDITYPLNVEWSLVFEVYFYCIVAALCLIGKIWIRQVIVAVWGAAILGFGAHFMQGTAAQIPLSYMNLAFIPGMFAWWLRDSLPFRGYAGTFIALILFMAPEFAVDRYGLAGHLFQSFAAAILVLAASRATLFNRLPIFTRLGNASYGIYLVHAPIITIAFVAAGISGWPWLCAVFVLALVGGIAFGTFEFRMHVALKALTRPRESALPSGLPVAAE